VCDHGNSDIRTREEDRSDLEFVFDPRF